MWQSVGHAPDSGGKKSQEAIMSKDRLRKAVQQFHVVPLPGQEDVISGVNITLDQYHS